MTLDGYCDHTAVMADDELHAHYSNLINGADLALYGRITYQLMEYWKGILANPTGDKLTDDFAVSIDRIPKVVFSRTLKNVDWSSARIAAQELRKEVLTVRELPGKDILVCSRSLIAALINHGLVDELQLAIHPVIVGKGLPLLDLIGEKTFLKLERTKTLASGAIVLYYRFR
ncbi:dihydrofolate reductase family protein [Dyadobacter sandarakinus]|uniref:Dihydrofolate reductase family protein n=2 Tax=Dyadobacter sandarakinus TaxID=2747268 RepID=A0ABX7IFY3_9BACT|nr:dihydrofolate reductase family protein [Dyadobacter sandarakinus]